MRPLFSSLFLSSAAALSMGCVDTDYRVHENLSTDDTETVFSLRDRPSPDGSGDVTEDQDAPGTVWVDTFEQAEPFTAIDILWVVDRSGSMDDYQLDLDHGLSDMFSQLPDADWRLNMISNAPDAVLLDEQPPLIHGASIEEAHDMLDRVADGTLERSFEATMDYVDFNPMASEWMRDDAALLVVLISDEDEQSHSIPIERFTEWLKLKRDDVFLSSVVNIDPNASACSDRDGWHGEMGEFQGDDFMVATSALNGMVVDICADDWSRAMRHATPEALQSEWALSHTPVPDSIQVFIEGEITSEWTFNLLNNSLTLDYDAQAGAHINVAYRTLEETH